MAAVPAAAPAQAHGSPAAVAANTVAAFLAKWEQSTKLSDAQYARITTVSKLTSERAIPKDFARVEEQATPPSVTPSLLEGIGKIDNIQQFYEWFASLEQEIAEEREEKFTSYLEKLCDYRSSCDVMLAEVDRALGFLSDLEKSYTIMSTKTGELHQACESLLQEQKRLTELTDLIKEKLAFYNDMEKITRQFSTSTVVVTDPNFRATLKRLDECIAFVEAHPTAKDQSSHLLKFRQLQNRGLSFLRGHIIQTITLLTQQVQAKIKTAPPGEPSEGGVLYLTFRTTAPQLKPLCAELEKRASLPEYNSLLNDCHNCYFNQRRALLSPIINASLRKLSALDLHAAVRTGCAYVVNVSCLEYQLYTAFFEKLGTAVRDFLAGISLDLYETLRPMVIHSHQLDVLCMLVSVIRNQILDDQLEKRGHAVVPFAAIVGRLLEDAQERIIFLAQTYIRDEIATFSPSQDDLAYPDKLQRSQETASAADTLRVIYATWYPTLQKTIICLSRLSLSLETHTFSGIAQEAVSVCISTLMAASKGITQQKSVLHGTLFLVRHFLILRKELTPFDVEFKIIEKSLDFSHMTDAISRLLSGRTPFAALASVVQAAPRVMDNALDSKKELDRALMSATETLVSLVIKQSMEAMVSFVTKASAVKITPADPSALRKLAFAHPEAVKALAQDTRTAIDSKLPGVLQLVQLYLVKQGGAELIVSNMQANMVKYLQQAQELLLGGGYTAEELAMLTFNVEELKAQVQAHFAALTTAESTPPPSPKVVQ